MSDLSTCATFGDCEFHKLSVDQKFNLLIVDDGNGCPAFKTKQSREEVTIDSDIVSADGSVPAGAYVVTFVTDENFAGTINGKARQPNMSYTFDAKGNKTPAIPYTISAGNITIDTIS